MLTSLLPATALAGLGAIGIPQYGQADDERQDDDEGAYQFLPYRYGKDAAYDSGHNAKHQFKEHFPLTF